MGKTALLAPSENKIEIPLNIATILSDKTILFRNFILCVSNSSVLMWLILLLIFSSFLAVSIPTLKPQSEMIHRKKFFIENCFSE